MAGQPSPSLKVLENTHVSPPPGSVPSTSLPLTFLDIYWFITSPMQRLLFYEFSYPTNHFTNTTLPLLKNSLSLALQHFFPFSGKLISPPPPHSPYILYEDGDSIPFIVAETASDFSHLIGNHARMVGELQALTARLPPATATLFSDGKFVCKQQPLMSIQVTVFPNSGISLGVTFNHVVADGKAFNHFLKSWASLHKTQGDLTYLHKFPPIYNRDMIKDPYGIASVYMKDKWDWEDLTSIPSNKEPVTIVFSGSHVEILKRWIKTKFVQQNEVEQIKLTTFVVASAYMWVCLVKHEEDSSPDLCRLVFTGDCRERLNFPATYFGNCLGTVFVAAKKSELRGENAILAAVKAIGAEIKEFDREPLRGAEIWLKWVKEVAESGHLVSIAGSPKFRPIRDRLWVGKAQKD